MIYAIIVGLLSIIPGLGFFVLRSYRQAYFFFILVVGSILLWAISPWQELNEISAYIGFFSWLAQIFTSIQMAHTIKILDVDLESSLIEKMDKIQVPPDRSGEEKSGFKERETVRRQLEFGENIVGTILGLRGRYCGYYLGVSDRNLIIIAIDFFSQPIWSKKIPLADVEKVRHKKGFFYHYLTFFLKNGKSIRFGVHISNKNKINIFLHEFDIENKIIDDVPVQNLWSK